MGTLAAGIKEIFATAKTTGSNVMLCGNDGTPDGHMTMANIASVLGGLIRRSTSETNLDNVKEQGLYYVGESVFSQLPSGFGNGVMLVLKQQESRVVQVLIRTSDSQMHWRMTWEDYSQQGYPVTWYDWNKVTINLPSFYENYADLSSLANALGVYRGDITTDEDYALDGVQYGYGLLILANISDGTTSTYNVNAFNVERISSADCGATVTKSSEYSLVIKRASGKTTRYVFVTM